MDLNIYNKNFGYLATVDDTSSVRWRRKYFEPGEVEIHLPNTEENRELFAEGNIIHRTDRTESAVVKTLEIPSNDNNNLVIHGRMGSILLERRIITPTVNFSGAAVELAMQNIVYSNCILNRPIPHLILGSMHGYTQTCSFQATYKNVLATVEAIGKSALLGFRVYADIPNLHWVFDVYSGEDHSVTNNPNDYIEFSDENGNIDSPSYTRTDENYKNFAYVGGEGEGTDRTIITIDQTAGEERRELWVDAKDLQQGSMTDAQYQAQLQQRGREKLAEACRSEALTAGAIDTPQYEYLTDWDLGDVVTAEKFGVQLNQRITEVEEVYENGVMTVTPVFGSPLPETLNLGDD